MTLLVRLGADCVSQGVHFSLDVVLLETLAAVNCFSHTSGH